MRAFKPASRKCCQKEINHSPTFRMRLSYRLVEGRYLMRPNSYFYFPQRDMKGMLNAIVFICFLRRGDFENCLQFESEIGRVKSVSSCEFALKRHLENWKILRPVESLINQL